MLDSTARLKIISRIKDLVLKHHFNIGNIDLHEWCKEVDGRTPVLLQADSDKSFEEGVHSLLAKRVLSVRVRSY